MELRNPSAVLIDPAGVWIIAAEGMWALVVTEDASTAEAALRRLGVGDIVTCLARDLRALQDAPEWDQLDCPGRARLCDPMYWEEAQERWPGSCMLLSARGCRSPHHHPTPPPPHPHPPTHPLLAPFAAALRVRARARRAVRGGRSGDLPVRQAAMRGARQ